MRLGNVKTTKGREKSGGRKRREVDIWVQLVLLLVGPSASSSFLHLVLVGVVLVLFIVTSWGIGSLLPLCFLPSYRGIGSLLPVRLLPSYRVTCVDSNLRIIESEWKSLKGIMFNLFRPVRGLKHMQRGFHAVYSRPKFTIVERHEEKTFLLP
ncbi:hypothetical protein AMTRI_Chr06g173300 [Amborella trichopoda]